MKEITIKLYSYCELSPEAKEKAYNNWLSHWYNPWEDEIRNTIEAFEHALDIDFHNWEYGCDRADYGRIEWGDSWNEDILALSGNRARAWFWNNCGKLLMEPRYHYYRRSPKTGKMEQVVSPESRRRDSKVFFTRVYDGTCPLTGYYLDNSAFDPMAYFCFGVKWDEKLRKHVTVPHGERWIWKGTTVEDIVRECAQSLFDAIQEDCEYCSSEKYFEEECEGNCWTFEKDGTRRNAV